MLVLLTLFLRDRIMDTPSQVLPYAHHLLRGLWIAMTLLACSSYWFSLVDRMADHGKLLKPVASRGVKTWQDRILSVTVRNKTPGSPSDCTSVTPSGLTGSVSDGVGAQEPLLPLLYGGIRLDCAYGCLAGQIWGTHTCSITLLVAPRAACSASTL